MEKEWIKGRKGENRQFKHEHLLNYVMNRWGLNKTFSVGATSELIRDCAPKNYEEWKRFYFAHAKQKKKDGIEITPTFLEDLGRKLFVKVSEVVQKEISSISEEECIDYVFNLVLGRTFEGYLTEVETVFVFSTRKEGKRKIQNEEEVVKQIKEEISRLESERLPPHQPKRTPGGKGEKNAGEV